MIGDRINQTVAYHLDKGLPDGSQIDNLVAWLTATAIRVDRIVQGWMEAGEIVVGVKAPIGPEIQLRLKLPKDE